MNIDQPLSKEPRRLTSEDMKRIRVGERYWHVSLDHIPDNLPYKKKLQQYIEKMEMCLSEGAGFFIHGTPQSGKTSCGIILAKAVASFCATSLYVKAEEIRTAVVEKTPFDEDFTLIERINQVSLVVMDDLGLEVSGEAGTKMLENVVKYRIDRKMPLVMISGYSDPKRMRSLYSEGFLGSLKSSCIFLDVSGVDWGEKEQQRINALLEDDE